jgi:hypothetical protein
MSNDFVSLLLQAAGGGIAATANTQSLANTGRSIMIAGLAFQVVSLVVFMAFWLDFLFTLRGSTVRDERFVDTRASWKFKAFNYGMYHLQ